MNPAFSFAIHRRFLSRFFSLCLPLLLLPLAARSQVNVLTYHNDNARTGQNLNETILTPTNVNTANFGKLFSQPVDGYVYAQPLYVSHVNIGGTFHNLLLIATEHDSVYAFDADSSLGANTAPLWHTSFINPAAGVTTVPYGDVDPYPDIVPEIGITGTPVIGLGPTDSSGGNTGTLYVVAKTKENGAYFQRIHALNLSTGQDAIPPVVIAADVLGGGDGSYLNTADGKNHVAFSAMRENERSGLVLSGNVLYIVFASHGDNGNYHGWVLAYNAGTLAQLGAYNTSPNGGQGGIWMSGAAPAVDNSGNLFYINGNGAFNANIGGTEYGDSFQRLTPNLTVQDYFAPYNQAALNSADIDQGSGGALLLPDSAGSAAHPHLLVGCGKAGIIFLLDRDHLGGYNLSTNAVVQQVGIEGIWSSPAFWNGSIYYQGLRGSLKQFSIANGVLSSSPISQSSDTGGYPTSTPSISANGATNGIVWTIDASGPTILHAHDPTNVGIELYNSNQNAGRDNPGSGVKFSVPTIANGKVYVGAYGQINVYGLLGTQPVATPVISSSGSGKVGDTVTITDATVGAALYYTTDGTTPTTASLIYTAPFTVVSPQTITAKAFKNGCTASAAASRTFGNPPLVPVVTATSGDTQVILNWPLSPGATGYNVKRATNTGGPYTTLLSGGTTSTTTNGYTDTGLTDGTTYYYVVSAVNTYGQSANSAEVSAIPTAASAVPSAPTGLTAKAGNGLVTLTWNPLPGAASFKVYRGTSANGEAAAPLAINVPGTTYSDAAVTSGITYYYKITAVNSAGEGAASNEASATPTAPTTATVINFPAPNGFANASGIQLNGRAAYSGNRLRLTDGGNWEAGSAFYTAKVNAQSFTDTFQVQMSNPQADGFTVCLQAVSPTALGVYGGDLGYQSIASSIAVKFDLYNNYGEGNNSTGLFVNGVDPYTPSTDLTPTGINLHSGDIFTIALSYNGATLTVTETDTGTGATATQSYALNLSATIGSSQVYAGFTGGTGGLGVTTDILNWNFTQTNATPSVLTAIAVSPTTANVATGGTQAFSAIGYDQFGVALSPQPTFTWSVDGGGVGSVTGSGLYSAGASSGGATVRATSGSVSGTAGVTVASPTRQPTGLTAAAASPFEIDLAWTNVDPSQTSLTLTRTGGGTTRTIPIPGNVTSYPDTGLTPLTSYSYTLTASGPGGNSAPFGPVSATTPDVVPIQASNLAAAVVSPIQLHLTWTDNSTNETGFHIYRKTGTGGTFALLTTVPASPGAGKTVSYDDIGLTPGTYYEYHLKAFNATGEAGDFTGTNNTTWASAPTALNAISGSGQAALGWAAPAGSVTSYTVTYGTTSGAETTAVTGIAGTSTTITGLTGGVKYYFVVSAVNAGGTGPVSNEASATPTAPTTATVINFPAPGGFANASGIQLNGRAAYNGNRLRLTDGADWEAGSAFYTAKVNAQSFTDTFQVQMTNPQADGFTVCLQAVSPTALGVYGGDLGYQSIASSIAVKFDLYNNYGEGNNSTGLFVNGVDPYTPSTDLTPTGINLHSGDIFTIALSYNGATLTVKETDTATGATATQSYALNLSATIGSSQVYAGFTGGTGGLGVTTDILNWNFTQINPGP